MQAFKVQGMRCGGCVRRITQAIQTLDADARVESDIAAARLRIDSVEGAASLARAITDAGYPACLAEKES